MSDVAGIDYSTHAIDIVFLNETENDAIWKRYLLPGGTSLERARAVRSAMPVRTAELWYGVYLIAIEMPASRFAKSMLPLARIQGAILTCLPRDLEVWEMTAAEWKYVFTGKGNATKEYVRGVFEDTARPFGVPVDTWSQDAADAYGIAFAARELNREAIGNA